MTTPVLTACAGFLLAVLWLDLMFDSQVRSAAGTLDETTLASIAGYYRRATTTSKPMSTLIAVVMALLLVTLAVEAVRGHTPGWVLALSALLAGGPILLALIRTVPNAVRLGAHAALPSSPGWPAPSTATTCSASRACSRFWCCG